MYLFCKFRIKNLRIIRLTFIIYHRLSFLWTTWIHFYLYYYYCMKIILNWEVVVRRGSVICGYWSYLVASVGCGRTGLGSQGMAVMRFFTWCRIFGRCCMACRKFGTILHQLSKLVTGMEYLFFVLLFLIVLRNILLEQVHFEPYLSLFT